MNDVDKLFAGLLNTEEDDAEPKAEPEAEPEAEPAASASNVKEPAAAAAGVEQLAEQDVDEPEDPMLELREQLNSIQSRLAVLAQSQAKPPEELPKVKELPHHEFVSDDDIADMLTDAKRLNDVLNKVYKKAYEDASNDALQAAGGVEIRGAGLLRPVVQPAARGARCVRECHSAQRHRRGPAQAVQGTLHGGGGDQPSQPLPDESGQLQDGQRV